MMAKNELWNDGRSGTAGCAAGNMALRSLQRSESPVQKLKGTVFETARRLLIGRVCSSDSYLSEPLLHWANASWDQHSEIGREAQRLGKEFSYLFITACRQPPAVHTWLVPAAYVDAIFLARGRNRRGATCALHIIAEQGQHRLGAADVSRHHLTLSLVPADVEQLVSSQSLRNVREDISSGRSIGKSAAGSSAAFDIPVSGCRAVRVQLPGPLSLTDVNRIKRWLDLSSDVLTEGYDEPEELRQKQWLAQQVREGLAQLERGEGIDGEEAFARLLARARSPQEAPP